MHICAESFKIEAYARLEERVCEHKKSGSNAALFVCLYIVDVNIVQILVKIMQESPGLFAEKPDKFANIL
jgi:hypothetical protein